MEFINNELSENENTEEIGLDDIPGGNEENEETEEILITEIDPESGESNTEVMFQPENGDIGVKLNTMQFQLNEINENVLSLKEPLINLQAASLYPNAPTSQFGFQADYSIPINYDHIICCEKFVFFYKNCTPTFSNGYLFIQVESNGQYMFIRPDGTSGIRTSSNNNSYGSIYFSDESIYGEKTFEANYNIETGYILGTEPEETEKPDSGTIEIVQVPLWESDITQYGVTDGLLLLILMALIIQIFFRKEFPL